MGKSIAFRYSVSFVTVTGGMTPAGWRERRQGQIPGDGKPNAANLAKYIETMNVSFLPGGVNEHVGARGRIVSAKLRDHYSNSIIAEWSAPMFQVVN